MNMIFIQAPKITKEKWLWPQFGFARHLVLIFMFNIRVFVLGPLTLLLVNALVLIFLQ